MFPSCCFHLFPGCLLGLLGCQYLADIERFSGGSDESSAVSCAEMLPDAGGADAVAIDTAVGCFLIDRSEVTVGQYADFLASNPRQRAGGICEWNADFAPGCSESDEELPVTCVDFCDALSYCEWKGKSLCPALRTSSGRLEDVWESACTSGGRFPGPYLDEWTSTTCNGYDNPKTGCESEKSACTLVSSGTLSTTCSSQEGIVHLLGNAAEWTDVCDGDVGQGDECNIRGGSFLAGGLSCGSYFRRTRNHSAPDVGFRCCERMDVAGE